MQHPTPPPRAQRLLFRVVPGLLGPQWALWVAAEITRPGFARRQQRWSLIALLTFLGVFGLLVALSDGFPFYALGGFVGSLLSVGINAYRLRGDRLVPQLLRQARVTADGRPLPRRRPTFTGREALVLVVGIAVLMTGTGVAIDLRADQADCRDADPGAVAAVEAALGKGNPSGGQGLFPRDSSVAPGSTLVGARELETPLPGLTRLAADVLDSATGRRTGPAVWQVAAPGGPSALTDYNVASMNMVALDATPSLSASGSLFTNAFTGQLPQEVKDQSVRDVDDALVCLR